MSGDAGDWQLALALVVIAGVALVIQWIAEARDKAREKKRRG